MTDLRVQPQCLEAEENIVAGALLSSKARATARRLIVPSQFYSDVWAGLLSLVFRLEDEGQLTDDDVANTNVILTEIFDSGIGEQLTGGIDERLRQWALIPHFDYADYDANRIIKAYHRREAIRRIEAMARAAWDGESIDALAERMTKDANEIRGALKEKAFRTMTSAELDAADLSTEYLVEGTLVKGQPGIMAAVRKNLKTTFGIDLALSLGSGAKFLNHFWTPRALRVALMSGESGDATIRETARRICWSKPWKNLADYQNVVWSFDLPRLGQPQTRRELTGFIRDNALECLIIDPAYLCLDLGEDASNLFSVGKKLRELTDIGHDTGCTMIIIHHCRKNTGDPFAPPELDSIAWAGFQEWARQWLLIGRREAYNPTNAGTHKLWLSCGGSAGHSGLWGVDVEEGSLADDGGRKWSVLVDNASKVIAETIDQQEVDREDRARQKAEKTLMADAEKLLEEYRKRPEGDTEKSFRERARLSGTRAGAANDKLLTDGLIEPCEVKKNGRPYDGFRVVTPAAGLTGTDRDSTGTGKLVPVGARSGTTTPIGGSPGPAHRDTAKKRLGTSGTISPAGTSPDCPDFDSAPDVFGGRPA